MNTDLNDDAVSILAADLYERAVKKIPEDTKVALASACACETNSCAKQTLDMMLKSAQAAEEKGRFVCSDNGFPAYLVKIGSRFTAQIDYRRAITRGFDDLVNRITPPLLKHITDPLTQERSHSAKDVPIITFDVIGDADYAEIICSPKALGSGQWADLQIFSFPTLETIERYILDVVMRAGTQPCPPVIIGVGIGGTFDYAAKMAKEVTFREIGSVHPEPKVADMEKRLTDAVNKLGYGAMGTGGDTTTYGVHIEYAGGHGFTPVAVCFNCWINRRTRARIYNDGRIELLE